MPRTSNPPIRRGIILDSVNPSDYLKYKIIHTCEDCSHFAPDTKSCTIGFEAHNHMAEQQKHNYELRGKIAFCRFCEID